jgi:hypothetical protein
MGLIVKRLHLVPVVKPIQVSVTLYVTILYRAIWGTTMGDIMAEVGIQR